jgi:predicted RNase H-like nuclease (RuvC/YqgF family)
LQNAEEATKLKAELKAAKERIPILEADLKKVTDSSKSENSRLIERCNRLQEELERSLNEDRQLKEKSGQLTVLNAQLTKKNVDLEAEVAKLQKIKAELVIEKD